jgi:hypothetical protein
MASATIQIKINTRMSPDLERLLALVSELDGDFIRDLVDSAVNPGEGLGKLFSLDSQTDPAGAPDILVTLDLSDCGRQLLAALTR